MGSHRVRSLPDASRRRVEALLPAALRAARQTPAPLQAAVRLFDLIETIAQRSAYLAPGRISRHAGARGAHGGRQPLGRAVPDSAPAAARQPDRLAHAVREPLDFGQIARQLAADLDACRLPDGDPDIERQMNLMRDVQRQASFQLLAQDLEGELTVEKLADQLSALADLLLAETIRRVWPLVNWQPGAEPRFAVIAYGKLGGKELATPRPDLVFLFDDPRDDAAEVYAAGPAHDLLAVHHDLVGPAVRNRPAAAAGRRRRPAGGVGRSLRAIPAQARLVLGAPGLTCARHAAGDAAVGERFERIRADILVQPRDPAALRQEVLEMRGKINAGHPNATSNFDLKHDAGGMVDVEFVTQYLVLCHSGRHPVLVRNLGNIALLRLAGEAGLIPTDLALQAGDAHRTLRVQHQMRLQGVKRPASRPTSCRPSGPPCANSWTTVLG